MVASEIPLLWGIFLAEKPVWIASGQFGFSRYGWKFGFKKNLSSLSAGSAWFVDTWYIFCHGMAMECNGFYCTTMWFAIWIGGWTSKKIQIYSGGHPTVEFFESIPVVGQGSEEVIFVDLSLWFIRWVRLDSQQANRFCMNLLVWRYETHSSQLPWVILTNFQAFISDLLYRHGQRSTFA